MKPVTFNDAVEIVEALPEKQRESLVEIVKKHLIEEQRDKILKNITAARQEYARGEIKRGSVDDLMI